MIGVPESNAAVLEGWIDALLATSSAAIGIVSTFEGRYVRANAAMAELLGMPLDELLRCDPFALALRITHPDDLVVEQKLFADLVGGSCRSYQMDKRYVRPDGSQRWGRLTFSAIFAEGAHPDAPRGAMRFGLLHVIDITEQKATSEALARAEEELRHAQKVDGIGRLAAGIAHDFNNLLTVIIGHGAILKALVTTAEAAPVGPNPMDDLDAILGAAERAAALTTQLLVYGRRETVTPRRFVLSAAVEALQRLLSRTIGSNIEIEQSLTARGAIFADLGHVGQVVMNLVLNARDAMPDGGRLGLATRDVTIANDSAQAGEWVALIVSDSGHGMTPEVQARIFEPFFTTRTDRPGTQGTGLGLATVRRIATELCAHIEVKSSPGAGTTITIFFPRAASAPEPVAAPPAPRHAAPSPTVQRVLVVEDEPAVRGLVTSVLLAAKYWVNVARSGEEALRVIAEANEPFHLIVTDLVMPKLGGAKLAQRLDAAGQSPRFLFTSGYANMSPAELSPHGKLLPKPFTPAQLLNAVREALEEPGTAHPLGGAAC